MAMRARQLVPGAEVALAFLAGATTFALVAVAVAAIESDLPVVLLAVTLVGAVLAVAYGPGVAYAVPVAMASVLAYDWYYLPPTHAHELPDAANLVGVLVYLALAVLIGQIASRAGHRAAVSDAARSELTEEQASLRRMATLVARGVPPPEVFAAVAREIGQVLTVDVTHIGRYGPDDTVTGVASWSAEGDHMPAGTRATLEGESVSTMVLRTGRPARVDSYDDASGSIAAALRDLGVRSSVGAPIIVNGHLWGVAIASSKKKERLPRDIESRIAAFTELVATAISNAQARVELARLAEEQAALRRVATLVAKGAAPTAVFDAVAAEMEQLLEADQVVLSRYEPGAEVTVVAHRGSSAQRVPPGTRVSHDGENVQAMVRRTERSARIEHFEAAQGTIATLARTVGVRVVVGAPIVVDGRLWGVISASWNRKDAPPADTEERMAKFAELLDTAIANADSRDQLTASRARLLTEGDEARRRVVRDLHDGAQQRLVHTIVTLKFAREALREQDGEVESLVGQALELAEESNEELRELAHGILPAVLARGGLRAGVRSVVRRLDLPVGVDVAAERFAAEIEASAYFVVAEALTNVVKHAHAGRAEVRASVEGGMLRVEVCDDGMGGADPDGHGLVGIRDRVTTLGGRLEIESPAGGGTLVAARLPLSRSERS
jgi:signal transduction histidine kinase